MTPSPLPLLPASQLPFFSWVNLKQPTYFQDISIGEITFKAKHLQTATQKNGILNMQVRRINTKAAQFSEVRFSWITKSSNSINSGRMRETVSMFLLAEPSSLRAFTKCLSKFESLNNL